jgi:peptide/nickel transport system ATP-binding protein
VTLSLRPGSATTRLRPIRGRGRGRIVAGLGGLVVLLVFAFAGPFLTRWTWTGVDLGAFRSPPSAGHWFGTTQAGRDMYAITLRGVRESLLTGLLAAVGATGLAAVTGTVAGYFGGWPGRGLMWVVDVLLVLPPLPVVATLTPAFRDAGLPVLAPLLAAFLWMVTARVVRGMTASLREREYVLAARYLGVRPATIIARHIVPHLASFLIVDATLNVSAAVIGETSLSYLGLGVRPPDVSLGTLIADGASSATAFPWLFVPPVTALVLIVFTVNLIGDGLRDALAPSRPSPDGRRSVTSSASGPHPAPLLAVSGLRVTFPGGVRAVRGVDLILSPGETLAVVGESGAGKSATALAITGLLPAARVDGSVRLRGRELLGLGDRHLAAVRGGDIAMICQDQEFTPVRRLGAQIAETIRLHHRVPRRAAAERAVELLRLAGVPDAARVARAFPHELSGGLRRRAMVAMAVAGDPAVILADEPTAGLDPLLRATVLNTLQSHQRRTGAALVLITHDLDVAARADRVLVMHAGHLVEAGPPEEILTRPRMPYTAALLHSAPHLDHPPERRSGAAGLFGSVPRLDGPGGRLPGPAGLPGSVPGPDGLVGRSLDAVGLPGSVPRLDGPAGPSPDAAGLPGSVSDLDGPAERLPDTAGRLPDTAGRSVPRLDRPSGGWPGTGPSVVLEVDGLARHYPRRTRLRWRTGGVRAVDGVRFELRAGETLALVGESGAGKTTVLMEILRLGAPQRGRIAVFGRDTATLSAAERRCLRRDLQIVFQDPLAALDPRMTVGAALAEPLRAHRAPDIAARVTQLLVLTGLEPAHASRHPGELSGGQRQRVVIARALALEPRLLLLDEPFSALDVRVQADVIALLRELKERLGLSYLLAAHDLAAVRQLADRVAVMRRGQIAEIGETDAIYETPAHPYTRALLSAADPHGEPPFRAGDPDRPGGCGFRACCLRFATLTPDDRRHCTDEPPPPHDLGSGHVVTCHFPARNEG